VIRVTKQSNLLITALKSGKKKKSQGRAKYDLHSRLKVKEPFGKKVEKSSRAGTKVSAAIAESRKGCSPSSKKTNNKIKDMGGAQFA